MQTYTGDVLVKLYLCTCACMHAYVRACMCVCMCVCVFVCVCLFAYVRAESCAQSGLGYTPSKMTERRNLSECTLLAGSRAGAGINKPPLRKVDTAAHMSTADEYLGPSAS